jgi:hypothetical protein
MATRYSPPGIDDLPVGRGAHKVVGTNDLAATTSPTLSGAQMTGYDGTLSGVGQITVQAALDIALGGPGSTGNRLFDSDATSDIYVGDWSSYGGGEGNDTTGTGALATPYATLQRAERATAWVPDIQRTLYLAPGDFTIPAIGGNWRDIRIVGYTSNGSTLTVDTIIQNTAQTGCGFTVAAGWPGTNSERGKLILWRPGAARFTQYGWIYKNSVSGDTWVTTGDRDFTAISTGNTFSEVSLQSRLTFDDTSQQVGDLGLTIQFCQVDGTGSFYADTISFDRCIFGDATDPTLTSVVVATGGNAKFTCCYFMALGTKVNAQGFFAVQPGALAQVCNGSVLDGAEAAAGTAGYCNNEGTTLFYGEVVLQNLSAGGFASRNGGIVGRAAIDEALGSALAVGALACSDAIFSWNPPASTDYSPVTFVLGQGGFGDLPPLYQRGGVAATSGAYCVTAQRGAYVYCDSTSNAQDSGGGFHASADGGASNTTRTGSTRVENASRASGADGNYQITTSSSPVTVDSTVTRTYLVDTNTGGADVTVNLDPAASLSPGTRIAVVHTTSDAHSVILHPRTLERIQGSTSNYTFGYSSISSRILESNGVNGWFIVGQADTPYALRVSTTPVTLGAAEVAGPRFVLLVDTSTPGSNVTINLPAAGAVPAGTVIPVVHISNDARVVILHPTGSDKIQNVVADYQMGNGSFQARSLVSNGLDAWWILDEREAYQYVSIADSATLSQTAAYQTFGVNAVVPGNMLNSGSVVEIDAIARVTAPLDGGATQFTTKLQFVDSGGTKDVITSANSALVTVGSRIRTRAKFYVRGAPGASVGWAGEGDTITNEATPKLTCGAGGTSVQNYATNAPITVQLQAKSDAPGTGAYVLEALSLRVTPG